MKNITAETELEQAFSTVCKKFKISPLNAYQLTAVKEFVSGNSDIFVNLSTQWLRKVASFSNFALNPVGVEETEILPDLSCNLTVNLKDFAAEARVVVSICPGICVTFSSN